jgi:hypothetical protein
MFKDCLQTQQHTLSVRPQQLTFVGNVKYHAIRTYAIQNYFNYLSPKEAKPADL